METDLKLFKTPQAMLYKYDQLNRITKSRSLEFSNNTYLERKGDKKYDEDYSYDANGNILTLKRHDDKAELADDFNYSYYANSNKLEKHKTTGNTYEYDAIGNLVKDYNEKVEIAWTPSGKVRSVTKSDGTNINFRYDAIGNRIAKIVSTKEKTDTTIYVRDAGGNVMSIYNNRAVSEVPIYGSSRIGEYMGKEREGYQTFNLRKYEIANHLSNIIALISDKVNLYSSGRIVNNKFVCDSARATVLSANDYYPGGLPMPGRQFNANQYRYGFNSGSEKDDEISGSGNHFTTFYREGDTRLLTWWSPDPMADEQPWQSSYSYMDGNPILKNDPDGDYSKFGAWWRSGFGVRGKIYQSGTEGNREVWGFNTNGVNAHFGGDARTAWKISGTATSDELSQLVSKENDRILRCQMTDSEKIEARGGDRMDPDYTIEALVVPIFKGVGGLLKYGKNLLFKEAPVLTNTGVTLWPAASGGVTRINGIEYTRHALERMQPTGTIIIREGAAKGRLFSRGVTPLAVENAIKHGTVTQGRTAAEVVRTFENVQVVTNTAGTRVISVIKLGH